MRILLVEDDLLLSAALTQVLKANRYTLDLARDGQAGLELATAINYDLILLDVQLPKLDGISLCRKLRSQGYCKPILLMTADDSDAGAIAGLDAGADDYISKPCAPEVLLARMRTLLRRNNAAHSGHAAQNPIHDLRWGKLCLNPDVGQVKVDEQVISLTATEYNLLELFLRHPQRIFSRSAILDQLWGFDDAPTDRAIVTHIKDLRKKLKAGGLREDLLETVYGMGYRLKPAPDSPGSEHPPTSSLGSGSESQSAMNQLLARFQDTFNEQIAVLIQAKDALSTSRLTEELRQAAQREAHKLAGSLASFGYPDGSKLARSLEHQLISNLSNQEAISQEAVSQYAEGVTALKQALAKPPATQTAPELSTAPGCHVLLIDRDEALIEQFKAESAARGIQIEVAFTPAQARSRLTRRTPDVVLLNLSVSDAAPNELSLLKEISQHSSNLPIVVLTEQDSLSDRLAISRLGVRQFLQKPATVQQILQAIDRVLPTSPTAAKILIVDDDPAILTLLSHILTPWGLEVVTLSEPDRFWKVLVETCPRVILLDLEMPGVNGLELCRVVRQDARWGDLPILVVTAHTDPDSLQQAFAVGADDFITKPVLGPELVTRILNRIERTRFRQRIGK